MAIPQQTIDQILDRTDLVDLIGQRVKLKKTGRTYSGCCPFHQEKSPSFHVYRDKQYYHCFGCQANGNAIKFLMDIDNRNFIEVMKDLAGQAGIELPKDNQDSKKLTYKKSLPQQAKADQAPSSEAPPPNHDNPIPFYADFDLPNDFGFDASFADPQFYTDEIAHQEGNLYDLLENIALFYQQQLPKSQTAQRYFKQRGLNATTIQNWRLGYAPEDWQHLEHAFPADIDGLKQLGLIRTSDTGRDFDLLRDRVIFPIRDSKGRVVGFGGRALNDEIKPKYINSPDSEVFHKNQLLYGLYEGTKNKAQDWFLVEGYMDVIALQQAGISGAVATLGTASNTEHLNLLFKRNHRITIAFDGDAAGQKAAKRTLEIALPLLNDGRELKFFILPNEHDPDSLIRQEGIEKFQQLWQQAPLLSDFLFALLTQQHDVSTPEGKSQVMGELRNLTQLLPQQGSYRYLLSQAFREKLGLGKRFTPQISHDASLSFNIRTRDEDFVIGLLVYYPYLYPQFEKLRAYIHTDELLAEVLTTLDQIFEQLPEDQERAIYYALGACYNFRDTLADILQRTEILYTFETPEKTFSAAKEHALSLEEKHLKLKMKNPQSLQESVNLRMQLNELTKKISLKLVSST
ncbi:DNA primase [Acinetobacter sp. MD2]|uniref:DNA primase n=1 Tax=Acinetobacter sp. MD2 TaxID=2600066 RepID=UPI002D1ED65D|nr:DNA primase [Acinetobacter sp. MD2]MEB3767626.1 DNA primase [Acinetobacter sp. MD2]